MAQIVLRPVILALSTLEPDQMQRLAGSLTAPRIDALLRKWLARLPHPYRSADRVAGIRYQGSILQAEFSLTQVLDRPLHGRAVFEQVIRENLDLGRPDQVQLIFARRVTKRTPSRFRTRVITEGVAPSLHVDYKHSRIKQYHKEGRALRTETIINDSYDFDVGRRLDNLDQPAKRRPEARSRPSKSWVSPPIDACCASNVSAITASSEPRSSMISSSHGWHPTPASVAPRYASAAHGYRGCCAPCSPSDCCRGGSTIANCAPRWRRCSASRWRHGRPGA